MTQKTTDANVTKAAALIQEAQATLDTAYALLTVEEPAPEPEVVVKAGDDLQAALRAGGRIRLEAGAVFAGSFTFVSDTTLIGAPGCALHGTTLPGIIIPPDTHNIAISDVAVASAHIEVIRVGENSLNQIRVEQAPAQITFQRVKVPTHRGRRAFALHGFGVELTDCEVLDLWDPAGSDSQAIYVGNAPGQITIRGGRFSAGSEIFLSGGDNYKIPALTPDGITLSGIELFRPASWKTDGVKRKVKNLFELKNGRNVTVTGSSMHGNWSDGQDGTAILLTPAVDGAIATPPKRSGEVQNVTFEDVHVYDCGSGINSLGKGYTCYTVNPLTGVVLRRCAFEVDHLAFGGRGQFLMTAAEPGSFLIDDCTFQGTGSSTIYMYPGTVMDPKTMTQRPGGKVGSITVTKCRMTLGQYGFMFNSNANALNASQYVEYLSVTGNTFIGPDTMKKNLPDNLYLAPGSAREGEEY